MNLHLKLSAGGLAYKYFSMNMRHLTTTTTHTLTHPLFLKLGILSEKGDKSAILSKKVLICEKFWYNYINVVCQNFSQISTFFDKMALFHLKHLVLKKVDEWGCVVRWRMFIEKYSYQLSISTASVLGYYWFYIDDEKREYYLKL